MLPCGSRMNKHVFLGFSAVFWFHLLTRIKLEAEDCDIIRVFICEVRAASSSSSSSFLRLSASQPACLCSCINSSILVNDDSDFQRGGITSAEFAPTSFSGERLKLLTLSCHACTATRCLMMILLILRFHHPPFNLLEEDARHLMLVLSGAQR